ncbi:hypothetical protein [Deminuibacter soli]|uniref:Uncharacterized protein n=1 Tax=Deminuibacter soli TaxID=2291815 RepID=A0A3E1NEV1_9BACT|nr:hypothetical protein [Deminuibacter soli]RFM26506.1 hypothetical protein DXN05_20005 [Deminuibacter soli]
MQFHPFPIYLDADDGETARHLLAIPSIRSNGLIDFFIPEVQPDDTMLPTGLHMVYDLLYNEVKVYLNASRIKSIDTVKEEIRRQAYAWARLS